MRQKEISNIDILVLCGGEGKRLRQIVPDRPKILAPINGQPLLDILLEDLLHQGFRRVILAVGHLKEQIKNHLENRRFPQYTPYEIIFSEESEPLGTGGAVKYAAPLIKSDYFFVMNGDILHSVDFNEFYRSRSEFLLLGLALTENVGDYGAVEIGENNKIASFNEKRKDSGEGLVNMGVYLKHKDIFQHFPEAKKFSLENDFFPEIIKKKDCFGFIVKSGFLDIGTSERYQKAQKHDRL